MNMAAAPLFWMSMKHCAERGVQLSPRCMSARDMDVCLLYIIHRGPQVLAVSFCHLVCSFLILLSVSSVALHRWPMISLGIYLL